MKESIINIIKAVIAVLFLILIIKILINHKRFVVETFNAAQSETKELEDELTKLETSRNKLMETINNFKEMKTNYSHDFYNKLKEKINNINLDSYYDIDNIEAKKNNILANIKQLTVLQNYDKQNKEINSILSLQNGQKISLEKSDNPNNYYIKFSDNSDSSSNKKYLTVDYVGNFSLQEKNENEVDMQLFNLVDINSESDFKKHLDDHILINKSFSNRKLKYPFTIVKSNYNENCLQNYNNNISVVSCKPFKSQTFKTLEEKLICKK